MFDMTSPLLSVWAAAQLIDVGADRRYIVAEKLRSFPPTVAGIPVILIHALSDWRTAGQCAVPQAPGVAQSSTGASYP
jgi:hypothetical protein